VSPVAVDVEGRDVEASFMACILREASADATGWDSVGAQQGQKERKRERESGILGTTGTTYPASTAVAPVERDHDYDHDYDHDHDHDRPRPR
jgi:hypothetical protein